MTSEQGLSIVSHTVFGAMFPMAIHNDVVVLDGSLWSIAGE